MSKIKCTLNLVDQQWLIQKVSLYPSDTEIEIMCRSENEITYFNGLSFGYKLISAEQTVSEKTWPEVPGIQIECADTTPIRSIYYCGISLAKIAGLKIYFDKIKFVEHKPSYQLNFKIKWI